MRKSFKSFIATTLEYQESQQIEPERLDVLVTRLRSGDKTVIDEIIKGHLRMAMSIVSDKLRNTKSADDIIGAALLALTEAVNDASTKLYDNNITAYITSTLKFKIKEAYARNHVVRTPSRTLRHKIAQGLKFEDLILGHGIDIKSDKPDAGHPTASHPGFSSMFALPYIVPIAKTIEPCIEIREALKKSIENNLEQRIIDLREEGYNYAEIGKIVGYSTPMIGKIIPRIEARFDAIYGK